MRSTGHARSLRLRIRVTRYESAGSNSGGHKQNRRHQQASNRPTSPVSKNGRLDARWSTIARTALNEVGGERVRDPDRANTALILREATSEDGPAWRTARDRTRRSRALPSRCSQRSAQDGREYRARQSGHPARSTLGSSGRALRRSRVPRQWHKRETSRGRECWSPGHCVPFRHRERSENSVEAPSC